MLGGQPLLLVHVVKPDGAAQTPAPDTSIVQTAHLHVQPTPLGSHEGTQVPLTSVIQDGHSHLQSVVLNTCPPLQLLETHCPLQNVVPDGHSHLSVHGLNTCPPLQVSVGTHCPVL
ncbi:MAG: hypothetical protein NVSMB27_03660 [Ktedonobacteraceae bacterium]